VGEGGAGRRAREQGSKGTREELGRNYGGAREQGREGATERGGDGTKEGRGREGEEVKEEQGGRGGPERVVTNSPPDSRAMAYLTSVSPSAVDFELRSLSYEDDGEELELVLLLLKDQMEANKNFELVQAFLNVFFKVWRGDWAVEVGGGWRRMEEDGGGRGRQRRESEGMSVSKGGL
jgi:hypothetical protein